MQFALDVLDRRKLAVLAAYDHTGAGDSPAGVLHGPSRQVVVTLGHRHILPTPNRRICVALQVLQRLHADTKPAHSAVSDFDARSRPTKQSRKRTTRRTEPTPPKQSVTLAAPAEPD